MAQKLTLNIFDNLSYEQLKNKLKSNEVLEYIKHNCTINGELINHNKQAKIIATSLLIKNYRIQVFNNPFDNLEIKLYQEALIIINQLNTTKLIDATSFYNAFEKWKNNELPKVIDNLKNYIINFSRSLSINNNFHELSLCINNLIKITNKEYVTNFLTQHNITITIFK